MSKHMRFFSFALTMAVVGSCAKKDSKQTAVADPTTSTPAAQAEPASTAPPQPELTKAPGAAGPTRFASCNEYKAALDVIIACEAIPLEAREAFGNAWAGVESSLHAVSTPEAEAAVTEACQAGVDGLRLAASDCF